MFFFETGARVIEILKLRYNNCHFDEAKKTSIVKLPNEKGISSQKVPVELTFSSNEFNTWIRSKDFKEDEYVFQYTYAYIRKRLAFLSKKYLRRHISQRNSVREWLCILLIIILMSST